MSTDVFASTLTGYQPAGDYATNNSLREEIQKTQDITDGKLNKAGDTGTGDQILDSGNDASTWSSSPQRIFRINDHLVRTFGQIDGNGNIQLLIGAEKAVWAFNGGHKTIVTPTNNNLLETSNLDGPRMRQCFRMSVVNGSHISWPVPYGRDHLVTASFTPVDNGNGYVHLINYLNGSTPDRYGVSSH